MPNDLIVGVGAANADLHGRSAAPLVLRDSNPGALRTSAGGVTRNILENLARLGERTALLTAVGSDVLGRYILEQCAAVHMGTEEILVCPGEASSSYVAVLDENGDMYVAMSDMRILENITPAWLETKIDLFRRAGAVVCDPCLPAEALAWITSGMLAGVPLYADPVSTAYAKRLRDYAGGFFCLKPNILELGALTGCEIVDDAAMERAADALLLNGTQRVVVSMGRRGCYWADREDHRFYRALRPVERMTDATGAGDAFLAGLIWAARRGLPCEKAADTALAAGVVAVTSAGTVSSGMCAALIEKVMEENQ